MGRRIDELKQEIAELEKRKKELNDEYAGEAFPEDARTEFLAADETIRQHEALVEELEFREEQTRTAVTTPEMSERSGQFNVRTSRVESDIYDVDSVRRLASSPQDEARKLNDNAKFAIERSTIAHEKVDEDRAKGDVERMLRRTHGPSGAVARHILTTGSDVYQRAFHKSIMGQGLSHAEMESVERAFTLGSTGLPVVWTLDPTIIRTSNYVINPLRQISRVETISGTNEWRGVTSGAVVATYETEATEAADQTPTLTQPAAQVQRAQTFVPFSREVDQDVDNLQSELAGLFQEAKDILEATQFLTGAGTTSFPQGILTGLTTTQRVQTVGAGAFVVGDLYALQNALPARARNADSQFIASLTQLNRIRALDTSGGSSLWVQLGSGLPGQLLGMSTYELSTMITVLTTGSKLMVVGDFSGGYLIVDRIGMEIELIPHLMGAANRYPTGQRGLWAMWRNTAKVLDANRFRYLETS